MADARRLLTVALCLVFAARVVDAAFYPPSPPEPSPPPPSPPPPSPPPSASASPTPPPESPLEEEGEEEVDSYPPHTPPPAPHPPPPSPLPKSPPPSEEPDDGDTNHPPPPPSPSPPPPMLPVTSPASPAASAATDATDDMDEDMFNPYDPWSQLAGADGILDYHAPPPPKKKDDGVGAIVPLFIVGFFGCFLYHSYQGGQRGSGRGMRTAPSADRESEGINLVSTAMGKARDGWNAAANRTNDWQDRRRSPGLANSDYARDRHTDPDEDGML